MAGVSRNVLAVLIAVTMIFSLVGTMAAIAVISGYSQVPVGTGTQGGGSGKVAVYLNPEPAPVTGKVAVYLDSSQDGG
jgi:hypothetical protein